MTSNFFSPINTVFFLLLFFARKFLKELKTIREEVRVDLKYASGQQEFAVLYPAMVFNLNTHLQ